MLVARLSADCGSWAVQLRPAVLQTKRESRRFHSTQVPTDNASEDPPTRGLEMILSFGNDIEALVELHVVALPIVTDHAPHFVFVGLDV